MKFFRFANYSAILFHVALALATTVILLTLARPASATGRAYGDVDLPSCKKIAAVPGVYSVFAAADNLQRVIAYEVALTPGANAGRVAARVRDILSAQPRFPRFLTTVEADLWTYHDPLKGPDFRQTISPNEFFTSPVGFHDYRGVEIAVVTGDLDPNTGNLKGIWMIRRVAGDPARARSGT